MTKFERVNEALVEKTRNSINCVRLTTMTDARHSGKYTTMNIYTNNTGPISFKTLNEVIEHFGLQL